MPSNVRGAEPSRQSRATTAPAGGASGGPQHLGQVWGGTSSGQPARRQSGLKLGCQHGTRPATLLGKASWPTIAVEVDAAERSLSSLRPGVALRCCEPKQPPCLHCLWAMCLPRTGPLALHTPGRPLESAASDRPTVLTLIFPRGDRGTGRTHASLERCRSWPNSF